MIENESKLIEAKAILAKFDKVIPRLYGSNLSAAKIARDDLEKEINLILNDKNNP